MLSLGWTLVAQVLYTVAAWPMWWRLYQKKTSGEHTNLYWIPVILAHLIWLKEGIVARDPGIWIPFTLAITNACITIGLILWYRRFPGGYRR